MKSYNEITVKFSNILLNERQLSVDYYRSKKSTRDALVKYSDIIHEINALNEKALKANQESLCLQLKTKENESILASKETENKTLMTELKQLKGKLKGLHKKNNLLDESNNDNMKLYTAKLQLLFLKRLLNVVDVKLNGDTASIWFNDNNSLKSIEIDADETSAYNNTWNFIDTHNDQSVWDKLLGL